MIAGKERIMRDYEKVATKNGYDYGHMTIGECIHLAKIAGSKVSDVIIAETMKLKSMGEMEVLSAVMDAFSHNLKAVEYGVTKGGSFLLGTVGSDLASPNAPTLSDDRLIHKSLVYTLAAQVGNHAIGLEPCAGTGDSCPYTGFVRAMLEEIEDKEQVAHIVTVLLKIGTIFRVGKSTTGCNMEGFGAGAAAVAAGLVELKGGSPEQMEKAIVLALSPTISVPCTPRVLVPGLCATHIGGAIVLARLASQLAMFTSIPVNVPADVMIAMAASVHPISAETIVPITIQYMEPFFKSNPSVEEYIGSKIKDKERERVEKTKEEAIAVTRGLSAKANSIVKPFGLAVVGGSSLGVGSPTNTARIAHFLSKGKIRKVKIELCQELFARRGINVQGVLMAAVFGCGTDDYAMYREIIKKVRELGIEVDIQEIADYQLQRVTIETQEQGAMVESLNRGGGRLVLKNAIPSLKEALVKAKELGIDVIDD
jgi:L-serine dehydratase